MSYDEDDYRYDDFLSDLYEEHKDQAIEEFKAERLQAYYAANPSLAQPALAYLKEGRSLVEASPSAALIFAAVSAEQFFKRVLLHPIVYGLVSDDPVAALVADLVISHTGMDRFKDLLFAVLANVGGIDFRTHTRDGVKKSLWEELKHLQKRRNRLLHRAEVAERDEAEGSLAVSTELLERIFPAVVESLGLHLHDDLVLCSDRACIERENLRKMAEASGLDIEKLGL